MRFLNEEELIAIGNALEDHHSLFYTFFHFGNITFDEAIPTACVKFSEDGEAIDFCFNPKFWDELDFYNRLFVLCHECLHILFNHGIRIKNLDGQIANIAADVVVNHYLTSRFGFVRNKIKNWESLCWIDTAFQSPFIPEGKSFEFYYMKLKEQSKLNASLKCDVLDDHGSMPGLGGGDEVGDENDDNTKSLQDRFVKKIGDLLSERDKDEIVDITDDEAADNNGGTQAGSGYVNTVWRMPKKKINPLKSWKGIVKKWKLKNKDVLTESDQWARMNRRNFLLPKNLILPSEMEFEGDSENKIEAWMFLDVSGSCYHLKSYFWEAAESVPKKYFNLKLFSFSTKVHEADLKGRKLIGGGGTNFHCINKKVNDAEKYPHIIMVITDGFGTSIYPKHPDRWHWFLTDSGSSHYFPKTCHKYKLSGFVGKPK